MLKQLTTFDGMTRFIVFSLMLSLIMAFTPLKGQQGEWKMRKENEGITIYTSEIEGSPFKMIRSHTVLTSTLSGVVKLITDIPGYLDWVGNCEKAELLSKIGDSIWYGYSETDIPWPLANRDLVFQLKVNQDPKTKIVTTQAVAVPDYKEQVPGVVRILHSQTQWVLTPLEGGKVDIEYTASFNPEGNIPAWMSNMTLVNAPFENLQRVTARIGMAKYQSATFTFIEEP